MKIAMFTNTYAPSVGGIERSVDIFTGEMKRQGHEVLIVAPEYYGATESTEDVLRVPAFKHINGTPHSVSVGFPSEISDQVKRFCPDVVHSHQPFLLGDSAIRVARSLGVPVIYTHHTFMERYLHWFPVDWRILHDIALKLPIAYANLVDHVVTPTQSVADIIIQRGVKTAISSIPTGIDADFFQRGDRRAFRARHGLTEDQFVLGHLGRLNEEKNLDYLADVAVHFVAKAPHHRRFLLAGEGSLVAMFGQRFAEAELSQQLVYLGLVQGQAIADAYAAMDAFIFTSLSDTQGLVLSEAMAAGNPVFALAATGARDMITHGVTGYLLPVDTSVQVFSDVLDRQIVQADSFAAMGEQAILAAQEVSIPACTKKMLDLYDTVIRGHRNPALSSRWEKLAQQWNVELELFQEKVGCLLTDGNP